MIHVEETWRRPGFVVMKIIVIQQGSIMIVKQQFALSSPNQQLLLAIAIKVIKSRDQTGMTTETKGEMSDPKRWLRCRSSVFEPHEFSTFDGPNNDIQKAIAVPIHYHWKCPRAEIEHIILQK